MSQWRGFLCVLCLAGSSSAIAGNLRGAMIVAADGNFLGTCDGAYGAHSISNDYSRYGSPYGTHSMFNKYGQYGSEYGQYSPFNKYSTAAPYIISADSALLGMFTSISYRPTAAISQALRNSGGARVTSNRSVAGGIDPNVLRVACEMP